MRMDGWKFIHSSSLSVNNERMSNNTDVSRINRRKLGASSISLSGIGGCDLGIYVRRTYFYERYNMLIE